MKLAIRLALMAWASAVALADAEVVLSDGRVLKGVDIRRAGDLYLLEQESGTVVSLPLALVTEVRLLETTPPAEAPPVVVDETTGIVYHRDPIVLAGSSKQPRGMDTSGPRQLAGQQVEPPQTSEQLAVLGRPSEFRRGVIDPNWTPGSGWLETDPTGRGSLGPPSEWSESPVDNSWEPTSGFDEKKDVLEQGRSSWQSGPIDSSWLPTSGFR